MPTVTINRTVSEDEVISALKAQLGSDYTVEAKEGHEDHVSVEKSTMSTAHVRLEHLPNGSKLHVHGGGLIIGRLVNEFTIANKVAKAIKTAPGLSAGG